MAEQVAKFSTEGDAGDPGPAIGWRALGVAAAFLPFIAILCFGVPSWFPWALALDTGTAIEYGTRGYDPQWNFAGRLTWSLLICCGVVAVMRRRGWAATLVALAILLAGLAVPQACLWTTGYSKYTMLGGTVPFTDAAGYLDNASRMVENQRIAYSFADRPMFPAFVSSIFQFTGISLRPVFAILLAFAGVGMFLAAREMAVRFGAVAAACFLFVIYVYYNRYVGTLMTEHLGLMLSLYAFALLLRGLFERGRVAWFAGLFFLSAALWARVGALFVLPALCIFTAIHFRKSGRFSPAMFVAAIAVMLVPMGLNRVLFLRVYDPATRPQSHFNYVAYGLLRGTSSAEALSVYGTDGAKLSAATWELFREKPHRALRAIRRTLYEFFTGEMPFSFTGPYVARLLLYAFLFAIALGFARATRSAYDGFSLTLAGGIIASVPFAPPVECDIMRIYAATMPLQACLAATGVAALVRLVAPAFRGDPSRPVRLIESNAPDSCQSGYAMGAAGLVLLLVFGLPLGRSFFTRESTGRVSLFEMARAQDSRGLAIHLVADDAPRPRVPTFRVDDFRRSLYGFGTGYFQKEADWLARLPAGTSVVSGGAAGLIIIPTEKLRRSDSRAEFDATYEGFMMLQLDRDVVPAAAKKPATVPADERRDAPALQGEKMDAG